MARKKGLMYAMGEYVVFIDADDFVDKNYLQITLANAIKNNADIVVPNVIIKKFEGSYYKEQISVYGRFNEIYIAENVINLNEFFEMKRRASFLPALIRRDVNKEILYHIDKDIWYGEDAAFMLLAFMDAQVEVTCNEFLYTARRNKESLSHNHLRSNYNSQRHLFSYLRN